MKKLLPFIFIFFICCVVFLLVKNVLSKDDHTWRGVDSHFYIKYSENSYNRDPKIKYEITISEKGTFSSKGFINNEKAYEVKGNLEEREMEELFNYIVNNTSFPDIPSNTTQEGILLIEYNRTKCALDFGTYNDYITLKKIVDKLIVIENKLFLSGKQEINQLLVDKVRESYNNKINQKLEQLKSDYSSGKEISFLQFAGLINKGFIDKNSKLIFSDEESLKSVNIKMAAGDIHPILLPTSEESEKIIQAKYLSCYNSYLQKLINLDSKYGIIPEWYEDSRLVFNWETNVIN